MMVGCAVVETGTRRAFSLFSLSARVAALQFGGARRRRALPLSILIGAGGAPPANSNPRLSRRCFGGAAGSDPFWFLVVLYAGRGGAAPD